MDPIAETERVPNRAGPHSEDTEPFPELYILKGLLDTVFLTPRGIFGLHLGLFLVAEE